MHTLWICLLIPGAVITYFVIGFLVYVYGSKSLGWDWKRDVDMCALLAIIWPVLLAFWVILAIPTYIFKRIAEIVEKGEN